MEVKYATNITAKHFFQFKRIFHQTININSNFLS